MACGEGGIIIGNDEELMDKCYTVMNHGTSRKGHTSTIGPKYRMNEFEAAVLMGQMDGVRERCLKRNENAAYLTAKFRDFKGLVPQKLYQGTSRGAWYRYAFTYKKEFFNNTERSKFLKVLAAEGVSMNTMYSNTVLNKEPWTDHILTLKEYQKMYTPERLKKFRDDLNLPVCDMVCQEIAMLNGTNVLLGTRNDMDDIVNAVMKIYDNRNQLASVE
jgi:dTDP-4-amino-4,6-dideoxygalactose transaminase